MKLTVFLSILLSSSLSFALSWEHDAETLCTSANLQVGGDLLAIMVPKPSLLYYAALGIAMATDYCPDGAECDRLIVTDGTRVRSLGPAETMVHSSTSFTFPAVTSGTIHMIGSLRTIDLDPNAAFGFRAFYGGQTLASGQVTHLCQRVVNGEPLPEMIFEYLKEPLRTPSYIRFRQGPMNP